jgi:hypothetical protein
MSERVIKAEGHTYSITERYGVVRSVERRGEKLVVNCGGSSRTIETQDALVAAEDGNEWHIQVGGSFSVRPGNKVKVGFAAIDGGAPHAMIVTNVDTGATWRWSLTPLLPHYRWLYMAIVSLIAAWFAIWSLVGEPSRRLAPYAFALGLAPIVVAVVLRFIRRRRLATMLLAEMGAEAG